MKARFINEDSGDVLKPKTREELISKWKERFGHSYEQYEQTLELLKDMGVDARINTQGFGRNAQYSVKGFQVFRGNWGVQRTLLRSDAESIVETLKAAAYDRQDFKIDDDERIYLEYQEARYYISKNRYGVKDFREKGEAIRRF